MGPLGWQETVFIFFVALLLFGPKKLPELGRTIGKAMTEFRRASGELKATFDREIKTLEQETDLKELTEVTNQYQYDTYNYDYSSYEGSNYEGSNGSEHYDSTDSTPSIASASAPEGAESLSVDAPVGDLAGVSEPSRYAPEETVARGGFETHPEQNGDAEPVPAPTEQKA
jgi:TatA/E family protein of Tat protein translocase